MTLTLIERRIAAYGGTFDPPHNGHIEVARAVARNFRLDQLLLVPAHRPPHKAPDSISYAYHRYAMAVLATLEEPRMKVSTIELDAPDKPYTFETLERLKSLYGAQARLFFVMGADSFEEIMSWREPERLMAQANLIVAARPGYLIATSHVSLRQGAKIVDLRERADQSADQVDRAAIDEPSNCCHIYLTDYVSEDVSSSEIRRRVKEGLAIDGLVADSVAGYIEKYELYRR